MSEADLEVRTDRRFKHVNRRLRELETSMSDMRATVRDIYAAVAANQQTANLAKDLSEKAANCSEKAVEVSEDIRAILQTAKGVGGFLAKHGPRIVAAAVGMAIYAGVIDGDLGKIVTSLFA